MILSADGQHACWAALVALVEDIHAPQYNLTEAQWNAAAQIFQAIPQPTSSLEDRILFIALAIMHDMMDAPPMSETEWNFASKMLIEYTAYIEAM